MGLIGAIVVPTGCLLLPDFGVVSDGCFVNFAVVPSCPDTVVCSNTTPFVVCFSSGTADVWTREGVVALPVVKYIY